MKTIAIDMDEVIADLMPKYLDAFETSTGRRLTETDLVGRKIYSLPGGEKIRELLYERGFFRDLPPIPGALEGLEVLRKRYQLYFVTAAMEFPTSFEDKYAWLHEHCPWVSWRQIVFCGDKSIIGTDYLLDDHAFNLETFGGSGLLFDAWHNRGEERFPRMRGWEEVVAYFENEGT